MNHSAWQDDHIADVFMNWQCSLAAWNMTVLHAVCLPDAALSLVLALSHNCCPVQVLNLKLQACPFTMLRPDLPGVLLGALVNLRVLDLDLASFAPPVAHPAEGEQSSRM